MLQLLRLTPDGSPWHAGPGRAHQPPDHGGDQVHDWAVWSLDATTRALLTLQQHGISAMLLATCHRVECYWWGSVAQGSTVRQLLAPGRVLPWQGLSGDAALRHLLRVTAGLESERRGEPEILGQVRAAWKVATAVGTTSPSLDHTMRGVINAARQLRRRLGFSDRATMGATIGAATVALVASTWPTIAAADPLPHRWLVVGTGAVGTSVAEALRVHAPWSLPERGRTLLLANRTPERAIALAQRCAGEAVAWEAWPDRLPEADVVIFAAHTAEPLVSRERAAAMMAARARPTLWVDLGAPPNCAPGAVPGITRRSVRDLATVGTGAPWDETAALQLVEQELRRWHDAETHRLRWHATHRTAATPIAV